MQVITKRQAQMDYPKFKNLSDVLRAQLAIAKKRRASKEACLFKIIKQFQDRHEVEKPNKFSCFAQFAKSHYATFKYEPNTAHGTVAEVVGDRCTDAKRGHAPDFVPILLFYEWSTNRTAFESLLREASAELPAVAAFLNSAGGRRPSSKQGLMRKFDINNRVGMQLIDWEVAHRRVAAAIDNNANVVSLFNLLINSLPQATFMMRGLKAIDIHSTLFTTLRSFSAFTELEYADFSYTQVDSLDDLLVQKLTQLCCGVTNITDLSPLAAARHLQVLNCGSSYVADLRPLKHCSNLKILTCDDSNVSTLAGLEDCAQLAVLDCSDTYVQNLDPLCALPRLKEVVLNGCHIDTSLEKLVALPSLTRLIFYQGTAEGVPVEQISLDHAENCLDRLREYYRLRGLGRVPA
jgi:Leucine-rich repeat (LRR) protein